MRRLDVDEYTVEVGNRTLIINKYTGRVVDSYAKEFEKVEYEKTKEGWTPKRKTKVG